MAKVGKHFPDNIIAVPVKMADEGEYVFTLIEYES